MKIVYIHLQSDDEINFLNNLIDELSFKIVLNVPNLSIDIRQCVLASEDNFAVDYLYHELKKYREVRKQLENNYGNS